MTRGSIFSYPINAAGQVVMPPEASAYPGTAMALPLSVTPPFRDPLAGSPMSSRETRGLLSLGRPAPGPLAAERVELPDEVPFDPSLALEQDIQVAWEAALAVESERIDQERRAMAAREVVREGLQSDQEVRRVTQSMAANQASKVPAGVVSPLSAEARLPPAPSSELMPIFEPMHNAREIAKQLVLLEDHLAQPRKRCPDCIRKHLLTAEALAEEAVALDREGLHRDFFQRSAEELRDISAAFLAKQDKGDLGQRVRELRKRMSQGGFSALDKASAKEASRNFVGAAAAPFMAPVAPGPIQASGSRADVSSGLPGVLPGVLVAYESGGQWYPGRVAAPGIAFRDAGGVMRAVPAENPSSQGVYLVTLPVAGYAVSGAEGPILFLGPDGARPLADRVIAMAPTPLSTELRGKPVQLFSRDGQPQRPFVLDGPQLFMADLIQAVVDRVIGGDLCQRVKVANPALLNNVGCQRSVNRQVARAAVVTAIAESRLNPAATNLSGSDRSYGLFQLNQKGGLGLGHPQDRLTDPAYNTTVFAREVGRIAGTKLGLLIKREAILQPTTVGEWVARITLDVQRPWQKEMESASRMKAADLLFVPLPSNGIAYSELLSQGSEMNTGSFAESFPQEWAELGPLEQAVQPILARDREGPAQITGEEASILTAAAEAWLRIGQDRGVPPAVVRAAWLYRLAGDMDGYGRSLQAVSAMIPGTTSATEADRKLRELRRSLPQRLLHREATTMDYVLAGAAATFLGVAVYAAHSARRM